MLTRSDFNIREAMSELSRLGASAAYIVPTATGLQKSIMDAHDSFRGYLREYGIHDFVQQEQGQDHKVIVDVTIVGASSTSNAQMSLYRPTTKSGDPRVWISGLKRHARAGNLIALLCNSKQEIFIVNVSDNEIWESREVTGSPLNQALNSFSTVESAAHELLTKLEEISARGFVHSLRVGPTGVGYTLETLLGINANANKTPDFKGIEIKAGRSGGSKPLTQTRTSLFSQSPSWVHSPLKSGRELLDRAGYVDPTTGRLQLYCTNRHIANPQGLYLRLDPTEEWLESRRSLDQESDLLLVRWRMQDLRHRLRTKHAQTFWVSAEVRTGTAGEEFHYTKVTHTRDPLIWNLGPAILSGVVTMDYTLSLKKTGFVRDHGYLFKLHPKDISVLFPPSLSFDLTNE